MELIIISQNFILNSRNQISHISLIEIFKSEGTFDICDVFWLQRLALHSRPMFRDGLFLAYSIMCATVIHVVLGPHYPSQ